MNSGSVCTDSFIVMIESPVRAIVIPLPGAAGAVRAAGPCDAAIANRLGNPTAAPYTAASEHARSHREIRPIIIPLITTKHTKATKNSFLFVIFVIFVVRMFVVFVVQSSR